MNREKLGNGGFGLHVKYVQLRGLVCLPVKLDSVLRLEPPLLLEMRNRGILFRSYLVKVTIERRRQSCAVDRAKVSSGPSLRGLYWFEKTSGSSLVPSLFAVQTIFGLGELSSCRVHNPWTHQLNTSGNE